MIRWHWLFASTFFAASALSAWGFPWNLPVVVIGAIYVGLDLARKGHNHG